MARSGSDRSGSDKAANSIKNYGGGFCCLNHRMKDGCIFMPRNKEVEDNEEMDEKKELHSAVKEAFAG